METSDNAPPSATGTPTGSDSSVARKVAVGIAGSVVTAAGVVMLVTPGPGIIAILSGLGILGSEFPAAHRMLHRLRRAKPTKDE